MINEAIEAISVPMPPMLVPMISGTHWSQKPESSRLAGTLLMIWLEMMETSSGCWPTNACAIPANSGTRFMLPMKTKNMMKVSGSAQSAWRNDPRSQTTIATNVTAHMTHSGTMSLTASTHTTNTPVYTIARQPP